MSNTLTFWLGAFAFLRGAIRWRRGTPVKDEHGHILAWPYGDGVHDDALRLRAAVAKKAASGGVINIAPGNYRITAPLEITNVSIHGGKSGTTAIVADFPTRSLVA